MNVTSDREQSEIFTEFVILVDISHNNCVLSHDAFTVWKRLCKTWFLLHSKVIHDDRGFMCV